MAAISNRNPLSTLLVRLLKLCLFPVLLICATFTQIDWLAVTGYSKPDQIRLTPFSPGGTEDSSSVSNVTSKASGHGVVADSIEAAGDTLAIHSMSRELLLRQYDNAVLEIRARLEHENLLFALKFSLVGAILGLLLVGYSFDRKFGPLGTLTFESPLAALIVWAAVITSAIIDSRIHYNADIIMTAGNWVRNYVENPIHQGRVQGWETYLATTSPLFKTALYPFLRANANVLTLVLFAATTFVYTRLATPTPEIRRVCQVGCSGCMLIFLLVGIHFQFLTPLWNWGCVVATVVGIAAGYFLWHGQGVHFNGSDGASSLPSERPGTRKD